MTQPELQLTRVLKIRDELGGARSALDAMLRPESVVNLPAFERGRLFRIREQIDTAMSVSEALLPGRETSHV